VFCFRFRFNITSLVHKTLKQIEIEMKWFKQITHHHTMNTTCTLGKLDTRKTSLEGEASCCSFLPSFKILIQRKCTHYGVSMTLWPAWLLQDLLPPLFCLNISIIDALIDYRSINNTIIMEPLPILVSQYLTWIYNHIGLGLGFLHASVLD
jgi:hypothetical protein